MTPSQKLRPKPDSEPDDESIEQAEDVDEGHSTDKIHESTNSNGVSSGSPERKPRRLGVGVGDSRDQGRLISVLGTSTALALGYVAAGPVAAVGTAVIGYVLLKPEQIGPFDASET